MLVEAATPRASAGAMVAAVAAMQEAISTGLIGAETVGECEEIRSEVRKQAEEGTYTEAPECSWPHKIYWLVPRVEDGASEFRQVMKSMMLTCARIHLLFIATSVFVFYFSMRSD